MISSLICNCPHSVMQVRPGPRMTIYSYGTSVVKDPFSAYIQLGDGKSHTSQSQKFCLRIDST